MSVYIAAGLRSPIGGFGRSLAPLRASEICSQVAEELIERATPRTKVERVIAGIVLQDMTESNPARIVARRIGLADSVPAFTVNMQCCSGMVALILAAQQVALGEVDCVLALGMESMSNAAHMVPGSRWGHRLKHGAFVDTLKECTLAGSKMWGDPWSMIDVAEHHAEVDGISREEMDEYAVISHNRAVTAADDGCFADEIVPIRVPGRNGKAARFEGDEHPRRDIGVDRLSALAPVREGGTITAGNAAGINDGAAAVLVCSEKGLRSMDVRPLARIVLPGPAMVGCDPNLMGYSCVEALNTALDSSERRLDEMDLIECNEGFAVQLLACERTGGWPRDRLNVDGGSVGLGHPVGMSGLRIVLHLGHALARRGLKRGVATVPAGSGLGAAVVLERV